MAYIKKKSERKFKITVCNGYKVNGQKRMKAQTITVPSSVPKRGIQQYVMAEAERIEKKFKYGVEESDQTHFEQYAENWLKRQEPFFKATTYAGYKRNLDIVYGHVPHPDSFTRHLRKLYKKCGLPEEYHLHTLRHFYATYLLQEGTSKQVAASLLGHADTAFLERTYCHPQDVAKRQAANLMQDLLNNQNPCYVAFMKNKNRKAKKAG